MRGHSKWALGMGRNGCSEWGQASIAGEEWALGMGTGLYSRSVSITGRFLDGDRIRARLSQLLGNLLSNAIEYSPEGEKIQITLQQIADQCKGSSEAGRSDCL